MIACRQGLAVTLLIAGLLPAGAAHAEDVFGYLRADADRHGFGIWGGANFPLGDGAYLAADLLGDPQRAFGQADVGVVLPVAGALVFFPSAGFGYDFDDPETAFLVPRLISILELGPLYLESWVSAQFAGLFYDGRQDTFYTRDFLLFTISKVIAVGPQVEVTHALANGPPDGLLSLPVGGRVNLSFGPSHAIGLFVGYDAAAASEDDLVGRLTALINF